MGETVKILAVSDIHGRVDIYKKIVKKVDNVDVIMIAGDVSPYDIGNTRRSLEDIVKESEGRKVLVVPGNVDDPNEFDGVTGVENVHGRALELRGFVVIGIGGSPPTPFFTINELSEDEIEATLRSAISTVNTEKLVILSHSPPYGTRVDVITSGANVGSHALRAVIEEFRPLLCVCGHIHEARGADRIGRTLIINPGPAMRGYYAVIELSDSDISFELSKV
ncbi:MAG: metallophosphoesterase family protein [Acidilobaceae archaeon]